MDIQETPQAPKSHERDFRSFSVLEDNTGHGIEHPLGENSSRPITLDDHNLFNAALRMASDDLDALTKQRMMRVANVEKGPTMGIV